MHIYHLWDLPYVNISPAVLYLLEEKIKLRVGPQNHHRLVTTAQHPRAGVQLS